MVYITIRQSIGEGRYTGHRVEIGEVADALVGVEERVLADFLEALGTRVGLRGGGHFLGNDLRRMARELREDVEEVTLVDRPLPGRRAS